RRSRARRSPEPERASEASMSAVRIKVKRQDSAQAAPRWEEFEVDREPKMNVIAALMAIQRRPQTVQGKKTAPVVWDSNCLEEVGGACTRLVNGHVRQACSTLVDRVSPHGEPIVLEPMTKFPVVRDLIVDRASMFESLKRVKAWIQLDGSYDL